MKRWNYLEAIANEICSSADISMGLLIGVNCREDLILGWCVVEPISCSSKNGNKVSCKCVSVEEAGSQNLGKQHSCVINEVKDTGIKDILNKTYHAGFTESVQPRNFDKMLNLNDELSW